MRQPAMGRVNRTRKAIKVSLPAPVGGWNASDAYSSMKKDEAVILENYVPTTTEVVLRKGSLDYATGITGTVETLMAYNQADGNSKLFAAAGSNIYDASAGGAVGAPVQTGLSNARWQYVNMATTGGKFLLAVNGQDKPRLYNGSTWVALDGSSTPAITGVTTSNLIHVNVFQRRVWFVEKGTLKVWYLPVDSIAGAANSIDFSSLFPRGGYLMAMGTWTIDSGNGMDDHAVFITSEGEVAVYKGIDPASSSTWSLVGVYAIGEPVGRRCFIKYASDMLIICRDGVMPLSAALQSSRVSTKVSITSRIQKAVSEAISNYASNFGWELDVYPEENLLILNVPVSAAPQQFVMYTLNGSWCNFTGWNAYCFERIGSNLYFGSAGKVVRAWTSGSDNGVPISAKALTSFQYHGGQGLKRYVASRPIIKTNNPKIDIKLGINLDFDLSEPSGTPSFSDDGLAVYDSSQYDSGKWVGDDQTIKKDWQTIGGIGYSAALYIKTLTLASVRWQATDFMFEPAAGL